VRVGDDPNPWNNKACPGTYNGAAAINCDLTGRYVGIVIPGDNKILTLAEVEIFEWVSGSAEAGKRSVGTVNILKGVAARQSSDGYPGIGNAERAVDGNRNGTWSYDKKVNSLTHTIASKNPWWVADLGSEKSIAKVTTFNRADCCAERLSGYEVRVGNDPNPLNNPTCPGIHDGAKTIDCDLKGRYVGIVIPGSGKILTLAEVEAFEWVSE